MDRGITVFAFLGASVAWVLQGCGGSTGASSVSGGTSGGNGGGPVLGGGSAASIAATFQIDVTTGKVKIVKSNGSLTGSARLKPGMFTGNSIGFNSSVLSNDTLGGTGVRSLQVSLVNNTDIPIGIDANGAISGLHVIFGGFSNTTGISSQAANTNVSTLAGSTSGFVNGATTVAKLSQPTGCAVGLDGSEYVADFANSRIRKISQGFVSTLAGNGTAGEVDGTATTSEFSGPYGLAINPADGSLIVADFSGDKIRRVTSAGVVNTVAGTGSAGSANGVGNVATFTNPTDVAVDANGNIYVSEANSNRIRKITLTGSPNSSVGYTVGSFAGSGTPGFVDGAGTSAEFFRPYGLTTDLSGDVYVADYDNEAIRRIDPSGNVTTIAGTGTASDLDGYGNGATFNGPIGVAFLNGTVFVSEATGDVVREVVPIPGAGITSSGWAVMTLAGTAATSGDINGAGSAATFNNLRYLAASPSSSLFVADLGNNQIRRVNPSAGAFPIGTPTGSTNTSGDLVALSNPTGITDGTDLGSGEPFISYPDSVSPGQQSSALDWNFVIPQGVTSFQFQVIVEANTAEFVPMQSASDAGSPSVDVRVFAGDPFEEGYLNGPPLAARFFAPGSNDAFSSLAMDGNGVLYYADGTNNAIRRIDTFGNVSTIAGIDGIGSGSTNGAGNVAQFSDPSSVVVNQSGTELFVADFANSLVREISFSGGDPTDPADWTVSTIAGTPNETGSTNGFGNKAIMDRPEFLALSSDGVLYASEPQVDDIRSLTFEGGSPSSASSWLVQTFATSLTGLFGLCCDPSGNVYAVEGSSIIRFDPTGTENPGAFAGSANTQGYKDATGTNAEFQNPVGLSCDAAGYIYVADTFNDVVRRISPAGVVTTVAGIAGQAGYANGAGNVANFVTPWGIAVSASGDLYVSEYQIPDIRKIQTVVSSASGPKAR